MNFKSIVESKLTSAVLFASICTLIALAVFFILYLFGAPKGAIPNTSFFIIAWGVSIFLFWILEFDEIGMVVMSQIYGYMGEYTALMVFNKLPSDQEFIIQGLAFFFMGMLAGAVQMM